MPDWFYHYTNRDFAFQVARDLAQLGVVAAEVWGGLYGEGFYALDLGPEEGHDRAHLREECFGRARPGHPLDGVLVLDPCLAVPPFAHQHAHVWLMPGRAGTPVAISHMITAVGWWTGMGWELESYL